MKKLAVLLCAGFCILFLQPDLVRGARLSGEDAPVSVSGTQQIEKVEQRSDQAAQKIQNSEEPQPKKKIKPKTKKAVKPAKKKKAAGNGNTKAPRKGTENFVTIDFDNVDIAVFIKAIGEMTGKNFVIDNQVKGNVTVYSPKKVSVTEAYKVFESVLEVHGFTAVASGDVIKIIPAKDAKEKSIETRLKNEAVGPEDKIVTQIVSLNHANPDDMKRILDPLISRSSIILSYPQTGMLVITDVLSNIKRLLKIIGALDVPGSGEQITVLPLKNANAQDIAKALTSVFQVDAQRRGGAQSIKVLPDDRTNTIIVMATEFYTERVRQLINLLDREVPRGDSTMHVYRLQNANAEDLAKVLMSLPQKDAAKGGTEKGKAPVISKEIQVQADKATNTLIISAARDDYKVIEEVIKSLDVSRAMVYLEALIMEVSVNKNFKLGVEWRFMAKTGEDAALFGGSGGIGSSTDPGAFSIFPNTNTFPSGFTFGVMGKGLSIGGVTFPTIGAVIQAVQRDQDIHILSTPQILTMDNEDAEIRVGQNIPYLTRQETSSSTVAYSNYEYRDVGVMLKVTPHINEDGFVRMKIAQEVTQLVSQSSGITNVSAPTTLKRTANTTVIIKDGNTVVIGGIIGDSSTINNYEVPCLGKIPLIGNLFKSKGNTREKTNLFVFLTPKIVRTQADAAGIYQEKRTGMGEMREGIIKLHENEGKKVLPPPPIQPQMQRNPAPLNSQPQTDPKQINPANRL
jgi:general secretion pathway protein D